MREKIDVRFSLFDYRKKIFISFFCLFCGLAGYAQTQRSAFTFKQFTFDNGTMSNVINCFLEDKDGYLWIGTGDGLKRFDGDEFTVLKHEKDNPTSLVHSEVLALCEDKKGRIWTGTQEGVGYFDKKGSRSAAYSLATFSSTMKRQRSSGKALRCAI